MELDLDGKTALVGGSTSGIGKAIATKFADAGASVVLIARNEEKLKQTISQLEDPKKHEYIEADFSESNQLRNGLNSWLADEPDVDILVNNTGGPPAGPILDADTDEFLKAYRMHLVCNQILVKNIVPIMKQQEYGRIINIISTSVRQPIPNLGVSNTTRGAVGNWAKTLANEIGKYNISVNNILPGSTRTNRLISIWENEADGRDISYEEIKKEKVKSIPMQRIAEPEEIANAALFLASPLSSYITGTNIIVDGGRTKCY